jgi:AcrR family transcriptional regulator
MAAMEKRESIAANPAFAPRKYARKYKRLRTGRSQAEQRATILDAVRHTLRTSSYEAFSMEEIAARALVTRRTLYNQFTNKDELYRSSCEALLIAVGSIVTDDIPERLPPEDGLRFFVERCMEVYGSEAALDLILSVVRDGKSQPWLVQAYHREVHNRLVRACENFILRQPDRTSMAPGVPLYVGEQLVGIVKALTVGPYIFGQADQIIMPTKERLSVLAGAYSAIIINEK